MTSVETIQEGVMVYPGAMPPIYQEELKAVIEQGGDDLTGEEALQIAIYRVGEIATKASQEK